MLPTVTTGLSKVLTYQDTPVYSDPVTKRVIATLPAGRALDMLVESFGYATVVYAAPMKIGFVSISRVVVEKDAMTLPIVSTDSVTVYSGPSQAFPEVMSLPPNSRAVALQLANGFYRISARSWADRNSFETVKEQQPSQSKFPWGWLAVGGGVILLLSTVTGLVTTKRK